MLEVKDTCCFYGPKTDTFGLTLFPAKVAETEKMKENEKKLLSLLILNEFERD
jgi:hypothetical protein